MSQPHIQTNFASGEWAPGLYARVDLAKYHSAAALIRNFYVDYRGGVSSRMGTQYILQTFKPGPNRLIPFAPSFGVGYALEFGQNYIRFHTRLGPVLETATTISGATQANPGVITDTGHGYSNGDWIFITQVGGMTQLNGNYYIVQNVTTNTYTLTDLFGNAINTTTYGAYTSGGQAQRVYTVSTPYNSADLQTIKYVQDVTSMILCHPSYAPAILTIISANNWTLTNINFSPTIATPTGLTVTTTLSTAANNWNYGYLITGVDINNQESAPTSPATLIGYQSLSNTAGANVLTWNSLVGAQSYNVYKCSPTYGASGVPAGVQFGFVANVTGTSFIDAEPGITPNFSLGPPLSQNPFFGAGVQNYTVTAAGAYTTVPGVTVAAPASGIRATAQAVLGVTATAISTAGSAQVGDLLVPKQGLWGTVLQVTAVSGGAVSAVSILNPGTISAGNVPGNPVQFVHSGGLFASFFNLTWGVTQVIPTQAGTGYSTPPAVTFSTGAATATANLAPASSGNPSIPQFFQERLVLAAPSAALQTYYMSQPGSFFNYNTSYPIEADDAITGQIIASDLNQIRSLIPVPTGLIALTSRSAWLINGGGPATIIEPSNQTANSQAFNGASDLRPLQINFDVLYGQAKGSFIRDLTYNFYANIYTGADISVLSTHLFKGYQIFDWAWAEEPYKTVWAVRNDGMLLSLAYVKEQDLVGWAHHDTQGYFTTVCSFTEKVPAFKPTINNQYQYVDSVYFIVTRQINGQTVNYVERMADRNFAYGMEDAWCVDAALQTTPTLAGNPLVVSQSSSGNGIVATASTASGASTVTFGTNLGFSNANIGNILRMGGGIGTVTAVPGNNQLTVNFTTPIAEVIPNTTTPNPNLTDWSLWVPVNTVTGLQQLVGQSVVGLGDGTVIGPFTVSATGSVALGATYSKVVLGLPFTPQFKTLRLEVRADGSDTSQAKPKKIPAATVRVQDTLGLSIGSSFSNLVTMKDTTLGNIPSLSTGPNQVITNLYSGDARQLLDPLVSSDGQYCIQQSNPLPATILGIIPETMIGNSG